MKQQFVFLNDDEDSRQPETRAIMDWARDIRFTASATLHGVLLLWNLHNSSLERYSNYIAELLFSTSVSSTYGLSCYTSRKFYPCVCSTVFLFSLLEDNSAEAEFYGFG